MKKRHSVWMKWLAAMICLLLVPAQGLEAKEIRRSEVKSELLNEEAQNEDAEQSEEAQNEDAEQSGEKNEWTPSTRSGMEGISGISGKDSEGISGKNPDGSSEKESEEEDPVCSACIGRYKGTTYTLHGYEKERLHINPLPFMNAEFDYVSSFAFYKDKAYYCCKDAGTSDFRIAIYETDPEGKKQKKLYEPEDLMCGNVNRFVIMGDVLYFVEKYWSTEPEILQIDLKNYEVSVADEVPEKVRTILEDRRYSHYLHGVRYSVDGPKIMAGDGEEAVVVYDEGSEDVCLEAVVDDNGILIYYSVHNAGDRTFDLYQYRPGGEEPLKVGSTKEAGGGGYFNW